MISGETTQLTEWNIEEVISTKPDPKELMALYDWENKVGRYTDGMTYLEVEQFNNTYNNFR